MIYLPHAGRPNAFYRPKAIILPTSFFLQLVFVDSLSLLTQTFIKTYHNRTKVNPEICTRCICYYTRNDAHVKGHMCNLIINTNNYLLLQLSKFDGKQLL